MNTFPLYFDIKKIKKHFNKLKNIDDKADFINYHFSVLDDIFNHESEDDIKKFIDKYNLIENMPLNQEIIFLYNSKVVCSLWLFHIIKFKSKIYSDIQRELLILFHNLKNLNCPISHLKFAFDEGNSFSLKISDIDKTIKTIGDDEKAHTWVSEMYYNIRHMVVCFYPSHFRLLKKKFSCERTYHRNKKIITIKSRGLSLRRFNLRLYLRNELTFYLKIHLNEYNFNIALNNAREKYPDKFVDDKDKYPLLDYDYDHIQKYSNEIFKSIEEKSTYFLYIINYYEKAIIKDEYIPEEASLCIYNLRKELDNYKELINLKYLKNSVRIISPLEEQLRILNIINTSIVKKHKMFSFEAKKPIIPKSKEDTFLIRHYFDIAKKYGDVPMLKHLVTNDFSKSFWSKKYNDIFFLTKIYTEIETKLEDGKINETTRDLLIKLKNDINSRIPKAQEKARKKAATKSSKQNSVDDDYEDENAYDRSQFHDKSPDE